MNASTESPKFASAAFTCPLCGAYAHQTWKFASRPSSPFDNFELLSDIYRRRHIEQKSVDADSELVYATCAKCRCYSIWHAGVMVYPALSVAPMPHISLPSAAIEDYNEARLVFQYSSRSAAALLRLVVQKLCIELGLPGKNLNADIGSLVERGLSPRIQQALDTVRVVGNESVHPGVLDVKDSPDSAYQLFGLVNFIVEKLIAEPNEIDRIFLSLPKSKLDEIKRRDSK